MKIPKVEQPPDLEHMLRRAQDRLRPPAPPPTRTIRDHIGLTGAALIGLVLMLGVLIGMILTKLLEWTL